MTHKNLSARLLAVKRDAASGEFKQLSPADIGSSWRKRFASEELETLVIPRRTLARRKARQEDLTQEETDKALRLARVSAEADRVFANQKKADLWLRTPLKRIADQTPLSLLRTEAGALVVEEILGQIDHGMFA